MIICVCNAKSERDVLAVIEEGAETLGDLQQCGVGTDCRSCHNILRTMLAERTTAAAGYLPLAPDAPSTSPREGAQ